MTRRNHLSAAQRRRRYSARLQQQETHRQREAAEQMTATRRRRSRAVAIGAATTALVGAVALLSWSETDYQAVCAEESTGMRVDDGECDDSGSGGAGFGRRWWRPRG
jgi:ferric-dicitrate binding protein FerR (iron transport regulator)